MKERFPGAQEQRGGRVRKESGIDKGKERVVVLERCLLTGNLVVLEGDSHFFVASRLYKGRMCRSFIFL